MTSKGENVLQFTNFSYKVRGFIRQYWPLHCVHVYLVLNQIPPEDIYDHGSFGKGLSFATVWKL